MTIKISKKLPKSKVIIIPLYKKSKLSAEIGKYFPRDTKLKLEKIIKDKDFEGEEEETLYIFDKKERILLLGLGSKNEFSPEKFRRAAASSRKEINKLKAKEISLILTELAAEKFMQAFIEGFILGGYKFTLYLTDKNKLSQEIEKLNLITDNITLARPAEKAQILAESVCYVRDLINIPPKDMTPADLAKEAKKIAKSSPCIKAEILEKKQIKELGLEAFYAVGQGSEKEPYLIILQYKYKPRNKKPILFIGKGITFDSGGINLKPTSSDFYNLEDLKCDMGGAAVVLGIFKTLEKLKLPLNIIGIIAAAENMPSGNAIKPGDIIKSFSGKTIEIITTDAEGRLVLADALAYGISKFDPENVIDIATLTGAACIVSLGYEITGMVTNNKKLGDKLKKASEETGEKIWEMPLDKDYAKKIESEIADIRNLSREIYAGVTMGGAFLEQFVNKKPWAHLDIGGTGWSREEVNYITKGGTGRSLRLLWKVLEEWK